MNFQTMSKQRKMVLIAAAVGIISMFLPWASYIFGSINGMHGNGTIVFLALAAAGVVAFLGDQTTNLTKTNWMIVLIAGGVAALFMIINFFDLMQIIGHLGIGFWGALAASIGVVAFAFMNRSASDSLQGGFDSLKGEVNRRMASTGNTANTTSNTSATSHVSHTPTDDPTRPTI